MRSPKRIDYSLLSDELKLLFEAGWKIIPMSKSDIDNNLNPNNYEYVRPLEDAYNNYVYRWDVDHYELLFAQTKSINWTDFIIALDCKVLNSPTVLL